MVVEVVVAVYVVQNTGSGAQCPRAHRCHFCFCCCRRPAGSIAVMGDSDGEWVVGGGQRVMVMVVVIVAVHVYRVSLVEKM